MHMLCFNISCSLGLNAHAMFQYKYLRLKCGIGLLLLAFNHTFKMKMMSWKTSMLRYIVSERKGPTVMSWVARLL